MNDLLQKNKKYFEKYTSINSNLIILKNWNVITVTGKDSKKYLNEKLSGNILNLSKKKHILTAHCNFNGKIWSIIRIFHYKKGFAYIIRNSVIKKHFEEMKKYSIFSEIKFKKEKKINLLGVVGKKSCEKLKKFFKLLPKKENLIFSYKENIFIYFSYPVERFLIIANNKITEKLKKHFKKYKKDEKIWLSLDIAAGIPNIDVKNINKFSPQSVNLQYFPNSISFKKGCYSGQEIITKIKNYNLNKNSLFWLTGFAKKLPKIGEQIEIKKKNFFFQ